MLSQVHAISSLPGWSRKHTLGRQASGSGAPPAAGLWLRNIQLGGFALPLAAVAVWSQDGAHVRAHGVMQGFDAVVWVVVLLNGLGGLLVAAVMKYADTIVKCFAAALAILSGTLLSVRPRNSTEPEHR